MSSEIKVDKISPASGTAFTFGDSGDTFTVPSGATIANSGTATGFGDANSPAFRAIRTSSNQSITNATTTKIQFNGEDFDTDNAFDSSTNYRFTVPSGEAGKYFFNMRVLVNSFSGGTGAGYYIKPMIYKNGSVVQQFQYYDFRAGAKDMYGNVSVFLNLSVSDYVEGYIYNSSADSSAKDIDDYLGFSCLEGFKVTT